MFGRMCRLLSMAIVGVGLAAPDSAQAQIGFSIGRGGVGINSGRGFYGGPGWGGLGYGGFGRFGGYPGFYNGFNRGFGSGVSINISPRRFSTPSYGYRSSPVYPGSSYYYSNTPRYYSNGTTYYESSPDVVYSTPSEPVIVESSPRSSAYLVPAPSGDEPAVGITVDRAGDSVAVDAVHADSPAERAGLRRGDLIRSINGKPIRMTDDVVAIVSNARPGDQLQFDVDRNGRQEVINVGVATRATALQQQ